MPRFAHRLPLVCVVLTLSMSCMMAQTPRHEPVQWTDSFRDGAPDEIAPLNAPFDMPELKRPVFPDRTFNIVDYGAVEGGEVKCTEAIAKAIDAANKAGGGKVLIPAGTWQTGPITIKSNVNLHAAKGANVLFSQDFEDYQPAVFSRHEGIECMKFHPFIYARNAENIGITGEGVFDGRGDPWWAMGATPMGRGANGNLIRMAAEGTPVEERMMDNSTGLGALRPNFVQPIDCKNVLIEGPEFRFGGFWTINLVYCENVIVRKVKVKTWEEGRDTPNGDGVNPDSSRNVLIEYCDLDTGDDCIAIKSGKDQDGLRVARPTENIVVRYVRGYRGHGGIVCGSETSGWIRNIYGHHCVFDGTDRGLRFKTGRGRGGGIENGWFHDVTMGTVEREAIRLNMLYNTRREQIRPVDNSTPWVRNLHFEDIVCSGTRRNMVLITGIPERQIENIHFKNIQIGGAQPVGIHDAQNITFTNVAFRPDSAPTFDILDSWDLTMNNVTTTPGVEPVVEVRGEKSRDIRFRGGTIPGAVIAVDAKEGATAGAVIVEAAAPATP
jgi:polygalacturonase